MQTDQFVSLSLTAEWPNAGYSSLIYQHSAHLCCRQHNRFSIPDGAGPVNQIVRYTFAVKGLEDSLLRVLGCHFVTFCCTNFLCVPSERYQKHSTTLLEYPLGNPFRDISQYGSAAPLPMLAGNCDIPILERKRERITVYIHYICGARRSGTTLHGDMAGYMKMRENLLNLSCFPTALNVYKMF